MNKAADFILSALGRNDFKNTDEYYESLVGAMLFVETLSELTSIRKIIVEALKK